MSDVYIVDGNVLEGGGQILRITISMSAILGIPVRVKNIRAGRPKPGLAAQHLKGIQLVAQMCDAKTNGAHIGSTEVEFLPGKLKGGHFMVDTGTAGAISLLIQVALPCALFAPSAVVMELKGGTNVDMAPQVDFIDKVFRPMLRYFGAEFSIQIVKRGYYPRGGGHVRVNISPVKQLQGVRMMERGELVRIYGWSFVAGSMSIHTAHLLCNCVKQELQTEAPMFLHPYKEPPDMSRDNCYGILLVGELSSQLVVSAAALGRRVEHAADAGCGAARDLAAALHSGACVDCYVQDQLIIYMALASGESLVRAGELTLHTKTAIHVVQQLARVPFNVVPLSEQNVIQCQGLGIVNKNIN